MSPLVARPRRLLVRLLLFALLVNYLVVAQLAYRRMMNESLRGAGRSWAG
ncbi:hypothetical protein [Kineosporia succinea]|uniref:Uncharacterized protein n=1 Tax=Kineosporia succinea TaxID=84632 RepID=A0ABT9PAI0_9ACTN|nr:hypothetical protein [Kineosporia succinea]MDP9829200.1 hypothetical protein [Kineosporia succinea]